MLVSGYGAENLIENMLMVQTLMAGIIMWLIDSICEGLDGVTTYFMNKIEKNRKPNFEFLVSFPR